MYKSYWNNVDFFSNYFVYIVVMNSKYKKIVSRHWFFTLTFCLFMSLICFWWFIDVNILFDLIFHIIEHYGDSNQGNFQSLCHFFSLDLIYVCFYNNAIEFKVAQSITHFLRIVPLFIRLIWLFYKSIDV